MNVSKYSPPTSLPAAASGRSADLQSAVSQNGILRGVGGFGSLESSEPVPILNPRYSRVQLCATLAAALLAASCARFQSKPLSPEKSAAEFESRSLTNEALRAFLETNHVALPGPDDSWDLKQLTLVAFYYQPALAESRAQLLVAQAAEITAGQHPNPSVSVDPGYDWQIPGNFSPWLVPVTTDIPIETAGKRGKRISQSKHLIESARWNLVGAVWQVRSQIRTALLNLYSSREILALASQQQAAQSNVVRLLEGQLAAGAISGFEVTQARTALATTQLTRQDAVGKSNQALVDLARALGVPTLAVSSVNFSFAPFEEFPEDLTQPDVRRQALLQRADVRGALAEYAASQSALQLEIANQYPNLDIGPGYEWNNGNVGDSMFTLGATVTLPIFNQNQGPIAEAEAKRTQAAAHFLKIQSDAIAEIDGALSGYHAALQQVATAKELQDSSKKRLDSVRAQARAGELEPQEVATAEVEFSTSAQDRLNALVQAQQALGKLEDAVQSPLTMPKEVLAVAVPQQAPAKEHKKSSRKEIAK